ncbi:MAG TPA: hypothetical protein PK349_11440 [Candidatus Hydrogenedentes bacterium]|nr:hypothetical protein [Candidatus Hydrogenedentota bacterium]
MSRREGEKLLIDTRDGRIVVGVQVPSVTPAITLIHPDREFAVLFSFGRVSKLMPTCGAAANVTADFLVCVHFIVHPVVAMQAWFNADLNRWVFIHHFRNGEFA